MEDKLCAPFEELQWWMVGRYGLRTTSFFCQSTFLLPFGFVCIGRFVRDDFLVVGGHLFDLLLRGTV